MKNVMLSLSPDTIRMLEAEKSLTGRSKSEIVRLAVFQYCATVAPAAAVLGIVTEYRPPCTPTEDNPHGLTPDQLIHCNRENAWDVWHAAGEQPPDFDTWYAAQQAMGLLP